MVEKAKNENSTLSNESVTQYNQYRQTTKDSQRNNILNTSVSQFNRRENNTLLIHDDLRSTNSNDESFLGNISLNHTLSEEFYIYSPDCNGFTEFSTSSSELPSIHVETEREFWEKCLVSFVLGTIALSAVIGNVLIILAVWKYRRLRTVTNCFVVSLASADLLVSILVLPLNITVEVTGQWLFSGLLCDLWVSCDVLLCTASILNLCCISLDRYFAITKPLLYSTRRSKRLAIFMVGVAWGLAAIITCPPIFGWKEEGRDLANGCALTRDPGYIIYSASGSFFIPLFVMLFVYARIYHVARKREKRLRPYWRSFFSSRQKRCDSDNSENISPTTEATTTKHIRPNSSFKAEHKSETSPSKNNISNETFSVGHSERNSSSVNSYLKTKKATRETKPMRRPLDMKVVSENITINPTCENDKPELSNSSEDYEKHHLQIELYNERVSHPSAVTPLLDFIEDNSDETAHGRNTRDSDIGADVSYRMDKYFSKIHHSRKADDDAVPFQKANWSEQKCKSVGSTKSNALYTSELNPAPSYSTKKERTVCSNKLNNEQNVNPSSDQMRLSEKEHNHTRLYRPHTLSSKYSVGCQSSVSASNNQISRNASTRCKIGHIHRFNRTLNHDTGNMRQQKVERSFYMKERKTAKTLAIVVGCFIICWLPFFLVYVIDVFCTTCNITPTLFSIITWLGYFNSTLNPLIYAMYNTTFRTAFWNLTIGLCCGKSRRRSSAMKITAG